MSDEIPSVEKSLSITVDDRTRNFILYLPKGYDKAGRMPLIFAIHGGSGRPEGMMRKTDFQSIADTAKFVLVCPEGIEKKWNDGRPTTPNQMSIDDVNFFSELCDYMVDNYPVDKSRIYATGISNGGFMSSRLGCELSNKITAIAVVAASMESTTIAPDCNPSRPVPVLYLQGDKDPLVPFEGGIMTAGAGGHILSHFQTIDKWVAINKCETNPTIMDLPDVANDDTSIKLRTYTGGEAGSEVASYVVENGGHTWPQGLQYFPESIIGKTNQDINASKTIWAFFKRFEKQ